MLSFYVVSFWNNSACNYKKNKQKNIYVAPFSLPEKQRIHHEGTHILATRKSSNLSKKVLILFLAEVGSETGQQFFYKNWDLGDT